jgi:acyl-CoA thioesterase-1
MATIVKLGLIIVVVASAVWFLFLQPDSNQSALQNIEPRSTTAGAVKIIAFGDSLTAGFGLPISEAYPAQLEAALKAQGKSVTVINAGVSGETTRGNLERATFVRSQNPDIVLLGIGGNDALRSLPIEDTRTNINETISILKSGTNPPVVILLGMQSPLNAGLSYKRTFDAMYGEIAKEEGIMLLPFITTEVFLQSQYLLPDRIHLNQSGYAKVIELYLLEPVGEVVDRLVE